MEQLKEYPVEARCIAPDIPLQGAPPFKGVQAEYLRRDTIFYRLADNRSIFVFNFGAITYIGIDEDTKERFIGQFTAKIPLRLYPSPMKEAYLIVVGAQRMSVGFNEIHLRRHNEEAAFIVAQVMAQSVAIDHYDQLSSRIFDRFAPINHQLAKKGKLSISHRDVHRILGKNNVIIQHIVTKLHILDSPSIAWEDEEMETIYNKLYSMFELDDRFETIEYKIRFVQENSQILLDSLLGQRESLFELVIFFLIVLVIVLFAYDVFLCAS